MDKSAFQKACHGGHAQIVSLMVSIARSRKDLESAYECEHWKNWLFQAAFFISIRSIAALEVLGWVNVNRVLDWILGHGSMIFCQGALDREFGE